MYLLSHENMKTGLVVPAGLPICLKEKTEPFFFFFLIYVYLFNYPALSKRSYLTLVLNPPDYIHFVFCDSDLHSSENLSFVQTV